MAVASISACDSALAECFANLSAPRVKRTRLLALTETSRCCAT